MKQEKEDDTIVVKPKTVGQEPLFVSKDLRLKLIDNFCVKKHSEMAANGSSRKPFHMQYKRISTNCKHILTLSRGQVLGAPKINTELAQVLSDPQKPLEKFIRYTGNSYNIF